MKIKSVPFNHKLKVGDIVLFGNHICEIEKLGMYADLIVINSTYYEKGHRIRNELPQYLKLWSL